MTHNPATPDFVATPDPVRVPVDVAGDARIQNLLLGGTDNYGVDARACEALTDIEPRMRAIARASRAFTERAVRELAREHEVRQFVDLGCGLPHRRNVHQIARNLRVGAKTVYVDRDPMVIENAKRLLGRNDDTLVVGADITDDTLLDHPDIDRLLDRTRPTAVLLCDVLQCVPDEADPATLIRRIARWQGPGGFVVVSHLVANEVAVREAITDLMLTATGGAWGRVRARSDIERLLEDLTLLGPGLTEASAWRPDFHSSPHPDTIAAFTYGGVASTDAIADR